MLENKTINQRKAVLSVLAAGMLTASASENLRSLRMPGIKSDPISLVSKHNGQSSELGSQVSSKPATKLSTSSLVSTVAFLAGGVLLARGIYKGKSDNNKYTNLIWASAAGVSTLAAFASADKMYGYSQLAVFVATLTYTAVALVKYKTWSINKLEKVCTGTAATALGLYAAAKFGSVPGEIGKVLNDSSIWLTVATAFLGGLPLWAKFFRKPEKDEMYKPNWKENVIPAVMPWCCYLVARTAAWISTDGASSATTYSALIMLAITSVNFAGQFRSSLLTKNSDTKL